MPIMATKPAPKAINLTHCAVLGSHDGLVMFDVKSKDGGLYLYLLNQ